MIVAKRKPVGEILDMIQGHERILLLGCRGCVTVCSAGGEREVEILASLLRLGMKKQGKSLTVLEGTLVRQCDKEFIDSMGQWEGQYDAVVSMACGVGVNFIANLRPTTRVYPAVNTSFFGGSPVQGLWTEQCAGCGNCILHETGGLCPMARCAKNLMNGPCGGSQKGRCEINPETACIWHLIHDRLERLNAKEKMLAVAPIRDWRTAGHGGPRTVTRDDLSV